ncbi:MAG TPA: hypothetical protein VHQ70_08690, partial [Syntrophomonadaceae bacterium]|nr:hypothetical protein [Syntrophomonadaceae bacterium]
KSASLMVNLPEIITGMQEESVNTIPGSLGEALRKNNLKVCMLGNGDVNEMYFRTSVAIGMDAKGRVPLGDVGPRTYKKGTTGYLGWQTNYDYLGQQVKNYRNESDLMIIELSDLARMENSDIPYPEVGQVHKKAYLRQIDKFIAQVNKQIDPKHDLIMVISAAPAQLQITNKNTFTPVIISGPGYNKGILTSGATRRDYIVANTDIAPTVLNFFGIKADNRTMIGRPMETISADGTNTLEKANNISNLAATVNRLRIPLVKGYVVLLIFIIALSVIAIFWVSRLIPFAEPLIIGLVTVPLVFLPLGKLSFAFDWEYILTAIFITVALTTGLIYLFRKDMFKAFVVMCIFTALALNLDIFTGSSMIASSVLGYDAMAGARYYGIGNEYMGILIGATIIIASVLYEKFSKPWFLGIIGLVLLIECYAIAGPSLGANSDGVLTAPFGYLVTLALFSNIRLNPRVLLGMAVIVLMSVLGITAYDMHRPAELQTHIGRAANQIMLGGWKEGLIIIGRKLGMNIKLIRYTIWSRVFLVMLASLALLVYRPVGAMRKLRQDRPMIFKGFGGIITAAIVSLIINDSGIVAAATISIYIIVPLLLLMFDLQKKGQFDEI